MVVCSSNNSHSAQYTSGAVAVPARIAATNAQLQLCQQRSSLTRRVDKLMSLMKHQSNMPQQNDSVQMDHDLTRQHGAASGTPPTYVLHHLKWCCYVEHSPQNTKGLMFDHYQMK
jgi:hypothetical protein